MIKADLECTFKILHGLVLICCIYCPWLERYVWSKYTIAVKLAKNGILRYKHAETSNKTGICQGF